MIRTLFTIAILAASACVASDAVPCGDGRTCPANTTCRQLTNPDEPYCATAEQLAACADKGALDTCTVDGVDSARCYDGVCLAAGCGNLRLDPDEMCDDGNQSAGDNCSADCLSTEVCGNGVLDLVAGERCDDGNLGDHDGCTSTCVTEQLHWIERTLQPPVRAQAAMAYDPRRDRVVIFGGRVDAFGHMITQTMEWDGATWVTFRGAEPPPGFGDGMAFDGQRIVLLRSPQTWLFDGQQWTFVSQPGPPFRVQPPIAFDARRRRVVVFGGSSGASPTGVLDDTWEWDGSSWTQVLPAHVPPARASALMAYDPVRGVTVLAGGRGINAVQLQDTWTFDGSDWTEVTPSTGAQPDGAALAFDTRSQRLIAYGASTLAWTGTQWLDLAPTSAPPVVTDLSLVGTLDGLLLFGGTTTNGDVQNETWQFTGTDWRRVVGPPPQRDTIITFDEARDELLVFGGIQAGGVVSNATWGLTKHGWVQHTTGGPPTSGTSMVYDPSTRTVVMYSGSGGDTWVWDGSAWSLHTSPTAPSGGPTGFDGQHITMVGGSFSAATLETWSWTGSAWQKLAPATAPPTRLNFALAYDPIRRCLVLFGGHIMFGVDVNDTWTFDGTTWTPHDVAVHPPASDGQQLTWNPARQRLVLGSAWEWDGAAWSLHVSADDVPVFLGSVATSIDGDGLLVYGSIVEPLTVDPTAEQLWTLRWEAASPAELCGSVDTDGDALVGCADPDCWRSCTPLCPPGTSCPASEPHCGDGVCAAAFESCATCAADCACTPVCGDFACDAGETACPGDCP